MPQLLTSALVYIRDNKRNLVECRALLDTGATANFISESVVKRMGLRAIKQSTPVSGINAISSESRGMVQITIQSTHGNFSKRLTCLTLPAIADSVPSEVFPRDRIKIPRNIKLADPRFHIPRAIDLLIGSGASLSLFSVGQINLSYAGQDLYLQKTQLGWVVAGGTSTQSNDHAISCCVTNLENQLAKFWTIEEVTVNKPWSDEERDCEAHFVKTVNRNEDGRYVVRLPFRDSNIRIGESRTAALKRLLSLERKLNNDATLKSEYTRVIEEYKRLNHMSLVEHPDDDGFYMPHHAVVKLSSNTTKVRIVFDASAKSVNGMSLNDLLLVGPTIQENLFSHLIRFRTYKYVLTADIEKMYRQVLVQEDDRRYQQILWREDGKIKTFRLNTLTFGVSSSPFLAIRTIHKLADDESNAYPRAADILKKHLYVDDLLTGAATIEEAKGIRDEIITLLSRGGFSIRQWASNELRVLDDLPVTTLHASYALGDNQSLKSLGISWNTGEDVICYSARPIAVAETVTKRNILSEIAKIYDPLGLMGPVVLYAKQLIQDLWRCGAHWDESVPQSIFTKWSEFIHQMKSMQQVTFDRGLFMDEHNDVQLHGFCDASNVGYGACIYARSVGQNKNVVVKLLCAKSRVSPLKPVTIPRLELCGALLLARLYGEASHALNIAPNKTMFWSDSTIVLHWLNTSPHLLKTYVANRVAEIRERTGLSEWRHVRSEDNPADAVSRGQLPVAFLHNQLWRTGPSWLSKNEIDWPSEFIQTVEIPELKGNICLTTTVGISDIFERYSSYSKLCRVVAYCLRFRPVNEYRGALGAKEINEAELRIIKILQASQFRDEIKTLENKQTTSKVRFASLNPFLDENGVIRVGGRLQLSKLTFSQKHPMLLPNRNHLTDKIIREIHERHHHSGIKTTLCVLRQRFWLLDGRNQVRKIIRTCTRCMRFNSREIEYKMGNLPSVRTCCSAPFANTGIDFCGPFFIKERKYRNRSKIKVYVCIFVCMTIKAVHLEVVSDLSSDGFLAALKRFAARRGLPEHIFSDNGTNFIGANNQLKDLYALFNSDKHKNLINRYANENRITWHFIPPAAPHFGGLWESTVKLFKHHYKRVVGDSLFTFEEVNTFTTEIEGILNSRPITTLSSDPNDMLVLTPAHYLIGKPLTTLPEGNMQYVPANRLSTWQHITKVRQDFWSRWHLEYLNELQTRAKWVKDGPKFDVGAIVLIKEKNLPCTQWALGRITKLYPGTDGISRAADVKTSKGEIRRSTKCLCLLPIDK